MLLHVQLGYPFPSTVNSLQIKMYSPSDEHRAIIPKQAPLACSFWKSATPFFMLGKERGGRMEGVETKSLFRFFLER